MPTVCRHASSLPQFSDDRGFQELERLAAARGTVLLRAFEAQVVREAVVVWLHLGYRTLRSRPKLLTMTTPSFRILKNHVLSTKTRAV